jgi:ABC-type polysaccharide/polyol phosphate export permease
MTERLGFWPRHRHLAGLSWTLVRTDFKIRYHGTLSGFLWALLKPLTMLTVLVTVFSMVFSWDPHYRLNLIVGLFIWDFFAESSKVGLLSLLAKGYLLNRSLFPRWIVVVTSGASAFVTLAVFSLAVLVVLAAGGHPPSLLGVGLYVFYVIQLFLIVVGFSLGASVVFLRYRDLNQVWEVITHAGFFLTPIVYPLRIIPEHLQSYMYLWPPTPVIQYSRMVLVEGAVPSLGAHLLLLAITVVTVSAGTFIFQRFGPTAIEHL